MHHLYLPDSPRVLPYAGGGLNASRFSNGFERTEALLTLGLMFGHAHFTQ